MIQANLNQVSQTTLIQLSHLAQQKGMSVEQFHEELLDFCIKSPFILKMLPQKTAENSPQPNNDFTFVTAEIPNHQQAIANNHQFIEHLLTMPKLEGYDDIELFPRSDEAARVPDFGEAF